MLPNIVLMMMFEHSWQTRYVHRITELTICFDIITWDQYIVIIISLQAGPWLDIPEHLPSTQLVAGEIFIGHEAVEGLLTSA